MMSMMKASRMLLVAAAATLAVWGTLDAGAQAPAAGGSESKTGVADSGRRILFYRAKPNGSAGQLHVMDDNGENTVQVGQSGSRPDHYPNWSPDGKFIVFESYRRGGWHIWISRADGTDARRVLPAGSGTAGYEYDPSFTADGKRILFVSRGDIFSVGVAGGDVVQITVTPEVFEFSPSASPRGKEVLFCAGDKDRYDIYASGMDGSGRRNLSNHASVNYAPAWSPDGSRIAFYSDRTGSFEPFLMDADGKNQKPLLKQDDTERMGFKKTTFVDAWDNDWGAMTQYRLSFSCDGSKIAFSRDVADSREIFTVGVRGDNLKRLTHNKLHDGFPAWAPCGR